ncbi:MAG: FAD-linked oxidase C-terminal domain-containing protein [Gemmatimonadota bacterium]
MTSPPFRLLAQCPLGLEEYLLQELQALAIQATPLEGGAEWEGGWFDIMRANLHLRVASRVLVEVGQFPARALGELERKAGALPWEMVHALSGAGVRFRVSASRSRLYHEKAIEERLRRAGGELPVPDPELPEEETPLLVARMHRDLFTLRLDTSGAHLHRRGYRLHVGEAPLRETLASALLMARGTDAGGEGGSLLDPFCGSGTLAVEEALRARGIPPGLSAANREPRAYAFTTWPDFPEEEWKELLTGVRSTILPKAPHPIFASDRDARVVEAAWENMLRAGVEADVDLVVSALSRAPVPSGEPGWVVTNPPFGGRLGNVGRLKSLYGSLGQSLRPGGRLEGWGLVMLSGNPQLTRALRLPVAEGFSTSHGGLRVQAVAMKGGEGKPGKDPQSPPVSTPPAPVPHLSGPEAIRAQLPDFLRDESNLGGGEAHHVYLPRTPEEVAAVVAHAAHEKATITVSGARTGITGGAVPSAESWILSLQRLDGFLGVETDPVTGEPFARVQAGLSLTRLAEELEAVGLMDGRRWIYPVDPTEWSASVGGTLATNAAGGRSYRYGSTASWVRALKVVLADGRLVELRRGEVRFQEVPSTSFIKLHAPQLFGPRTLEVPAVPHPAVRCVAGYGGLSHGGDLVDLFVGSEGTLGVVVEAELRLTPAPEHLLSLMLFLPRETDGLELLARLREDPALSPLAMEYLDPASLDLLREERAQGREGSIPALPDSAGSALFLELDFPEAVGLEALDAHVTRAGASLDQSWAGDNAADALRMRLLRHAVPEAVNASIARRRKQVPGLHKVGTDLAVPDASAPELYEIYHRVRKDAEMVSVLFGHGAENHLHLNFLPSTEEELARARALHLHLAQEAVRLGGSVSAEHGIGRIKRDFLEIQHGPRGVAAFRQVKAFFDPHGILNPGVLFTDTRA